ncbi:type II secretion system protein GspD [Enterobacter roggenkampii]|nr:type II secretion system protein GspD [Enterobacter roggenkampii]
MRRFLMVSMLLWPLLAGAKSAPVRAEFEVSQVPVPEAVNLLWREVFHVPYVLDPQVSSDKRVVSLHLTPELDARAVVIAWLTSLDIHVTRRNGADFILYQAPKPVQPAHDTYVYTPLYRTVDYLSPLLSSSLKSGGGSGTLSVNTTGDRLVVYGTKAQIKQAMEILPRVDVRAGEVEVKGVIFEVQNTRKEGSGIALAAKLLSGHFSLSTGAASGFPGYLSFSAGGITAMYELLSSDSRFRVVSAPSLRVIDGEQATFTVGAEVPVVGAVSYQGESRIQSVNYRDSGVIFKVKPRITGQNLSLQLEQQLSNFVQTESGVNDTPTLIKRQVSTSVMLHSGEVILIGGLAENKQNDANTGFSFLPAFARGHSDEKDSSDIVILLQARRI